MEPRWARLWVEMQLHQAWLKRQSPKTLIPPKLDHWVFHDNPPEARQLIADEFKALHAAPEASANGLRKCAQRAWDSRKDTFLHGRGTLRLLFDALSRRLTTERALATVPAERTRCLERYWRDVVGIEEVNKARYAARQIDIKDLMESTYYRIDAEIRLAEAKGSN